VVGGAVLGQHGDVRVVAHVHRQRELLGEHGLQRHSAPSEVRGGAHDPERVDDAGRADADAEDRCRGPVDQSPHERRHERDGRLAGRAVACDLEARDDGAVEVDDRAEEAVVLGEVDADDLERAPVDVDQRRGLAGSCVLALSELDDEALGDELRDEIGDRDPGEPGSARDIRSALRTGRVERLQHERPVVAACVLGEQLARRAERARTREDRRTAERHGEHVGSRPVRAGGLGGRASLRIRRHVC